MTTSVKPNNHLEKFLKEIPGRKRIPKDIDAIFVDTGDLRELVGINAIVAGISRILLTTRETYLFDPRYGLGLHRYIFEPKDEITKERLRNDVLTTLRKYEDRCKINVDVRYLKNVKGFAIDLLIKYEGEEKKLTINVDESLLKTLPER